MTDLLPNSEVVRATYRWLAHAQHGVSEVRVIRPGGGIVGIGLFDDEEAFVRECLRSNAAGNVYVGIQPRPRRLLDLAANAIRPLKSGAGSKDIEVVTATVIDLDPVRPKDTASTDPELALAVDAADRAADWVESQGFLRPRRMMSGNGVQLWCALKPIALDGANRELVQANLKAFEALVRAQAGSEAVKVDSIHDVARIIKAIGTVSHKGTSTSERPHRVSAPLDALERAEDERLATWLAAPHGPPPAAPASPGRPPPRPERQATAKARRTPEGEFDWESPVEMCGPVQRLWQQGLEDRSVAIFDMVLFFAHKGLGLDEITDLVLEYDRRGLGKLGGRDGAAYVRNCYDKAVAMARADGSIAPPCHSLQRAGYCRVNREPGARCEVYDFVFDIEKAVEAIPADVPAADLEYRLKPILEAISHRDGSMHGRYAELIAKRFSLKVRDLRRTIAQATRRPRDESPDASGNGDEGAERSDSIEGEIWEDASCYYMMTAQGEARYLSSFTLTPKMRVETEDTEIVLASATTDKGTTVEGLRLPLQAFHSKRDLIRHLPSADLQWTGSDNNVQGLLRVLARYPVPSRPGSRVLGDYKRGEHHLWLCPRGAISKDGFVDPSPVIYVPGGSSLDGRVRYEACDDATFQVVARKVFEHLPRVNLPQVIVPVLGWFFAAPMKPRFMERVGSFPTLFIWGTQGSGKSSLVSDILWPLSGIKDAEPYSATETEFALLKILTSTRSIPIFIDEYKPYDMPKHRLNTLHRYLRRLYRGETEERGRPDQTVNTYHLQAPLCVAGETRPTEAALLERILTANPEKAALEEREDLRAAFRELKTVDLSLFAARYVQFCLGRDFDADLAVARAVAQNLLARRKVPIRVAENITAMLLGVHLFEQFADACGYTALPTDLGARAAVDAILADVLETDHGVKNALDHFVEMLQVMAIQGELLPRVHYVLRDGVLYVHLESAYDSFRQHCRRIDYEGEIVDLKALRRLLHENHRQGGYVTVEAERVYFGVNANRRRAFGIDLGRTDLIDPDTFVQDGASADAGDGREARCPD